MRGFWDRATWTDIYGGVSADNNGRYFAGSGADGLIQRNLVIGTSLNTGTNGFTRTPRIESFTGPMDLATPTAFATYHSTFDIRNNILINFPAVANTRSGVFASEDYYIRPVDKGHLRNTGNLLIASHYGIKLPPVFSYYTLAGALWDPHNAWGGTGANNYFVYDTPFFTYGQTPHVVQPAGGAGGVLVNGPFYGFNDFVVNNANDPQADLMALRVTRFNQQMDSVGGLNLTQAPAADEFLAHMRHFAAHPAGIYKLEFPTIDHVEDVHFAVENMHSRSTDSLILAVEYSGSMRVSQVYASSHWLWRNQSVAEWPSNFWGKTIFRAANSRDEVFADTARGSFWHDVENNLVWMKMRGGLAMAWEGYGQGTADQFSETSDQKLYREFGIRIYGQRKPETSLSGPQGWHLLANPHIQESMADWLLPVWTQGAAGSDAPASSQPNLFRYTDGATAESKQYTPITDLSAPLGAGTGLAAYIFSDDDGPRTAANPGFPKSLYSYGTVSPLPFTFPISYNNTGQPLDDGWNLIGNPSLQPMPWAQLTRQQVLSVGYRWNPSTSAWIPFDGVDLNPEAASVPPFTGFFVKATGTGASLVWNPQASKTTSTPAPAVTISLRAGRFTHALHLSFSSNPQDETGREAFALQPLGPYWLQASRPRDGVLYARTFEPLPGSADTVFVPVHLSGQGHPEGHIRFLKKDFPPGFLIKVRESATGQETALIDSLAFPLHSGAVKRMPVSSTVVPDARVQHTDGTSKPAFVLAITQSGTTSGRNEKPEAWFALLEARPNPFNPSTLLRYRVSEPAPVRLLVTDLTGRILATVVQGVRPAGVHEVRFDASPLASGVYLVVMESPAGRTVRKITLLK